MLNFEGLLTQVFEAVEEEQAEENVEEEADRGLPEVSIQEELTEVDHRGDDEMHKDSPTFHLPEVHRFPWSPKCSPMRRGNQSSASAPQLHRHPGLPPIRSGSKRQEWKPVRRKQVPKQSHLDPLTIIEVDTAEHWSPPKIKGGGAWGGMLQSQHRRLAGVLAKQHKEVSNLQNQLAALEQLNRMGGQVGQNAQTDGTVHEYMAKIAPKFGRRGPQWQPSSHPSTSPSIQSQEYSVEISEQADAKSKVGDEPLPPDRQSQCSESSEHLVSLAPALGDSEQEPMECEHNEQMAMFVAESQEDVQVDCAEAAEAAEVCAVKEQEEQEEQEKELTQGPDELLFGLRQANSEVDLPATEEFNADAIGAPGRVEDVEDVADNIPDLHNAENASESQEAISQVQSFFKGQAQASLRASLGEAAQRLTQEQPFAVEEAAIESIEHLDGQGTSLALQGCEGLSASWMKEFEAASAVSQPGRATAEVLIDNLNLDQLEYLSRRSSGHCMVIREGQGDFLGQIGAMKDPGAVEEVEEKGEESEESSEGVLEESAPDTKPEALDEMEAEITQPAVKDFLIRGKDWSTLAAECDALLESCKRPEADDDDDSGGIPHELEAEHIEAAMATLPGLSEEREMDLDL